MKSKKVYNQSNEPSSFNEFGVEYIKNEKKWIHVFSSFEDEKNYNSKKQASLSYDERLSQLEELRKLVYKDYLLPDGNWPPLAKVITITKQ